MKNLIIETVILASIVIGATCTFIVVAGFTAKLMGTL